MGELFSVYQFFPDGASEQVRENVPGEEAVKAAMHYCTCVGAKIGTTVRVIITDIGDSCVFEWTRAEGIVWPLECKGRLAQTEPEQRS